MSPLQPEDKGGKIREIEAQRGKEEGSGTGRGAEERTQHWNGALGRRKEAPRKQWERVGEEGGAQGRRRRVGRKGGGWQKEKGRQLGPTGERKENTEEGAKKRKGPGGRGEEIREIEVFWSVQNLEIPPRSSHGKVSE